MAINFSGAGPYFSCSSCFWIPKVTKSEGGPRGRHRNTLPALDYCTRKCPQPVIAQGAPPKARGWRHRKCQSAPSGKQPREASHVEGIQCRELLTQMGPLRSLIGDWEAAGSLATAGSCQYHPRGTEGCKEQSDVRSQGCWAGLDLSRRSYQKRQSHYPKK